MGDKFLYGLCFAIIVVVAYLVAELSPAPAKTEIRVAALLCGLVGMFFALLWMAS